MPSVQKSLQFFRPTINLGQFVGIDAGTTIEEADEGRYSTMNDCDPSIVGGILQRLPNAVDAGKDAIVVSVTDDQWIVG